MLSCSLTVGEASVGGKALPGWAAALHCGGLRCAPTALRCWLRHDKRFAQLSASAATSLSVTRLRRRTHCVRCALSVQTAATSQMTKRASRAAACTPLLGAAEARRSPPGHGFAGDPLGVWSAANTGLPMTRLVLSEPTQPLHGDHRVLVAPMARLHGGPVVSGAPTSRLGGDPVVFGASITHPVPASRQAVAARGDFGGAEERSSKAGARSALRDLTHRSCLSAVSAANAASSAVRPWSEHRREVGALRRPPPYEPLAATACRDAPHFDAPHFDPPRCDAARQGTARNLADIADILWHPAKPPGPR
jgi:hypothetical protein